MSILLVMALIAQVSQPAQGEVSFESSIVGKELEVLEFQNESLKFNLNLANEQLELLGLRNQQLSLEVVAENRAQALLEVNEPERASIWKSAVWPTTVVEVSWENPEEASEQELTLVREAVTETWEAKSKIRFIGWGKSNSDTKGIRIRVADEGPHCKTLGRYLDGMKDGMVLNFRFGSWCQPCSLDLNGSIKKIAVHEFGHALGFAHEHNRPDTPEWCRNEHKPQGRIGDHQLTVYDPESVMNYCSADWNNAGLLSPLDIVGLQTLYGKPDE